MIKFLQITEENFAEEVEQAKLPVVILCWSDIEDLPEGAIALYQSRLAGKAIFGTYRVGYHDTFATSIRIGIVPSILVYRAGEEIGRCQPAMCLAKLIQEVEKIIQKNPH